MQPLQHVFVYLLFIYAEWLFFPHVTVTDLYATADKLQALVAFLQSMSRGTIYQQQAQTLIHEQADKSLVAYIKYRILVYFVIHGTVFMLVFWIK